MSHEQLSNSPTPEQSGPRQWRTYINHDKVLALTGGAIIAAGMYIERQPSPHGEYKMAGKVVKVIGGLLASGAVIDAGYHGLRLAKNWLEVANKEQEDAHLDYMMKDMQ